MASKSLFDFIENNKSAPTKTEQTTFLYPKDVRDAPKEAPVPIQNKKTITVLGKVYEVSIE